MELIICKLITQWIVTMNKVMEELYKGVKAPLLDDFLSGTDGCTLILKRRKRELLSYASAHALIKTFMGGERGRNGTNH